MADANDETPLLQPMRKRRTLLHEKAKLGLPEVHLGLLPGAGGTPCCSVKSSSMLVL